MKYTDKAIGFAKDLVPLVKNGSKILTYRLGNKYDFLQVGDTINVMDSSAEQVFGEVEITEISYTIFKDLPIDRQGHEKYPSKKVQRETFGKYYGRNIEDNEKILVLGFKLIS